MLDTGPLGLISEDILKTQVAKMSAWLGRYMNSGYDIFIHEIADYEVRRELIRTHSITGIARLEALNVEFSYLAITTIAMHRAAEFWAQVRRVGLPTASPEALDGDCILAAQAVSINRPGYSVTITTTNLRHLSRFSGFELLDCPI